MMSQPLPHLLERTATILADSARLLLDIEDSIAPLLAQPPVGGSTVVRANLRANAVSLQKIDLLSQTLQDLSFWLDDLAEEVRHRTSGNLTPETAMTRVRLADLRERLLGQVTTACAECRPEPLLF